MNEKRIQQVLEKEKADAIVRLSQLRHTYLIAGWMPVRELNDLIVRLKQASKEVFIETLPTSRHGENQRVGGCFDRCRISPI